MMPKPQVCGLNSFVVVTIRGPHPRSSGNPPPRLLNATAAFFVRGAPMCSVVGNLTDVNAALALLAQYRAGVCRMEICIA